MTDNTSYYCERCNKTLRAQEFYGSNNLEKYPEGKLNLCKQCISAHVDNFDPDTYLWILQECDVPYIPEEWNKTLAKYGQDRKKLTGATILGRYLSKMKMKQFKDFRWKDTEHLQDLANKRIEETMKRQGYDAVQIHEAVTKATFTLPEDIVEPEIKPIPSGNYDFEEEDYFDRQSAADLAFNDDLTDEDRLYLRLKWGKAYKPEEWIALEQLYEEMMASYDIQGAGHIDTLKLVCKTSLKANQLLDIGDVDGAQKMIKMYEAMMKSGKFTAAQNKAENGDFIDSIGELIELCEKQGYIERYYVETPKDKVDLTIADMQRYTKNLIEDETNLSIMVEKAIRENEKEDREEATQDELDIVDDIDLSLEDLEKVIKDSDYEEFDDFIEEELAADEDFIRSGF